MVIKRTESQPPPTPPTSSETLLITTATHNSTCEGGTGGHGAFYEPLGIHWIQKMGPERGEEKEKVKSCLQRKSCLFETFVILQLGMESWKSLGDVYGIACSDPAIPLVNPVHPFHTHPACIDLRQMGFAAIPRKSNETCQARGPVLPKAVLPGLQDASPVYGYNRISCLDGCWCLWRELPPPRAGVDVVGPLLFLQVVFYDVTVPFLFDTFRQNIQNLRRMNINKFCEYLCAIRWLIKTK